LKDINIAYIERYFEKKVINPFQKINELNLKYIGEKNYINIKKSFQVDTSFNELNSEKLFEIQKNIMNLLN